MKILLTGVAGFIGMHCAEALLRRGDTVLGLDNLNDYYDPPLKRARLDSLKNEPEFSFLKADLVDREALSAVFVDFAPDAVLHLAAQAGVRYSLVNPQAYIDSNLTGFVNVLEACRQHPVRHLVFASSSSVYGANTKVPFCVTDATDHPVSLYAATKKANEALAHSYSHLFGIPTTGLRFFTVYGPFGRPDMAYYSFTKALFEGREIEVYNHGDMERDFTYIDDIVAGVIGVLDRPAAGDPAWTGNPPVTGLSLAPYRLYNIGHHAPVKLMRFIEVLENLVGRKAKLVFRPMAPGDVRQTYADISELSRDVGFKPAISIEQGLARFVDWYKAFHKPGSP